MNSWFNRIMGTLFLLASVIFIVLKDNSEVAGLFAIAAAILVRENAPRK